MPLVAPQGVHLELIEVHFWEIRVSFIAILLAVFAASLCSGALDSCLVEVTDVDMVGMTIDTELETPLCHSLLDSLIVRRVPSCISAPLAIVHKTANLI